MSYVFAIFRMLAFVIGTLIIVPFVIIFIRLTGSVQWAKMWHGMACMVFNIKVRHVGVPRDHDETPTLFVSNHLSYLDIIVMGAHMDAIFVAKSEVADWPIFGFLAKLQKTIFIRRTREAMNESKIMIGNVLRAGNNVILFAEGTSTDGRSVKPFKAGLLEVMYEPDIAAQLQPVAIVLDSVGGKNPDDQTVRDTYAWWRPEDTLAPHLWAFAKAGGAHLTIHYQLPIDPKDFHDRKALAQAASESVAAEL